DSVYIVKNAHRPLPFSLIRAKKEHAMAIFNFIGRLSVRYRYIVIALWLGIAIFCIRSFPSLSSVANSDNSSFLPGTALSLHAAQLASPFQPNSGSTAVLVAVRNGGPLTTDDQSAF